MALVSCQNVRECLQHNKSADQPSENSRQSETENSADENPIAPARLIRDLGMAPKQIVVAFICSEPQRKSGAKHGNDADQFVDQNVQAHARKQDFRQSTSNCINQN